MFTPWFVVNLALAGSLSKNWNDQTTRNKIITLILISITGIMTIVKIVLFILYRSVWAHRLRRPTRVQKIQTEMAPTKAKKEDDQIETL